MGYAETHSKSQIKAKILIFEKGGDYRTVGPGVSKDISFLAYGPSRGPPSSTNIEIIWWNSFP